MDISEEDYEKVVKRLQKKLRPLDVEHIMFVDIDENGKPRHFLTIGKGSVDQCIINKRQVIGHIVDYWPKGIIMAHNHPGNTPIPSVGDTDLTLWVSRMCRNMNVKLMDHIIVLKDYEEYFSYRSNSYYSKLGGVWRSRKRKN